MSCHLHSTNHEANNSLITKELEIELKIKSSFAILHKTQSYITNADNI